MATVDRVAAGPSEAELRRARDRLAEAQRLARVGSWEWDIPANSVIWSDELYRIYGLRPGDVEPSYEGFLERVHPDDRDSVDERNRRAFADHQPFEDVKRCLRPDGSEFLMRTKGEVATDASGAPVRMVGVCEDVTASLEAERATAELAAIVESSSDAIIAVSPDGTIRSWSPGAARLYGYSAADAIGTQCDMLIPLADRDGAARRFARALAGERIEPYEARRVRSDGGLIEVSVSVSQVAGRNGEPIGVAMIERDVTERRQFEAQLRQFADDDPLTGLANRRRFGDEVGRRMDRHQAGAVLVVGLDSFRYANESVGRSGGDELLRQVGRILRTRVGDTGLTGRLGGDEFGVLLPDADEAAAEALGTELLRTLRDEPIVIAGRPVSITASIGVAGLGAGGGSAEQLIARADRAMYAAKEAGRDRLVMADEGEVSVPPPRGWEHRLRDALATDGFELHAQPIRDLRTEEVIQYELLLRLREGENLVPPSAFLGVAERLGLIHAIDRWVVSRAIAALAERPRLRLGVNLSAASLDDPQLLETIGDGIATHGVDPARLIFEITETAAIGNLDVARRLARSLERLGCSLALDDFGTGFGSFYYLKHLPARYLKIDGEFVAGPRSRTDELVVESIVRIARGLGINTIAEFVEDAASLEAMRSARVDFVQGFHIGRPEPLETLPAGSSGDAALI